MVVSVFTVGHFTPTKSSSCCCCFLTHINAVWLSNNWQQKLQVLQGVQLTWVFKQFLIQYLLLYQPTLYKSQELFPPLSVITKNEGHSFCSGDPDVSQLNRPLVLLGSMSSLHHYKFQRSPDRAMPRHRPSGDLCLCFTHTKVSKVLTWILFLLAVVYTRNKLKHSATVNPIYLIYGKITVSI